MVGIRISIVTMVESMVSMVAKEKSSFSSRLSISRPLTIVSMVGKRISIISMVQSMVTMMAISIGTIMVSSFSSGISLSIASNGSKQTEGNHSNGSHHIECL